MGLIIKKIEVNLNPNNVKYFENLGYEIPKRKTKEGRIQFKQGTKIIVKVKDLQDGSNSKVNVQCDGCEKLLENIKWQSYKKYVKDDGKYYCNACAKKLYSNENTRKTKLKNSLLFKQWCIENDRLNELNRWDFGLNKYKPDEISFSSTKKYYFKCPRGLHSSELKQISNFTSKGFQYINCKTCNSFAQWGIDNLGEDFLKKYWDYKKNEVNPWEISHGNSYIKVWIICQEKKYHGSYDITCNSFTSNNSRCSYCSSQKIHFLDSLETLYPKSLELWSDKNKKAPYEYSPKSGKKVWWKCSNSKHGDYLRSISDSNRRDFRCPECDFSQGEERINNCLINKNWMKISQQIYNNLLNINDKNYYIQQKTFKGLVGVGNGLLSYDFYIPKYNLLIEYQGEQHEKPVDFHGKGLKYAKKQFEIQQEHDRRKKEYTLEEKYNFLEIWYWDYDNIEEILTKEFNLLSII
jgi:hypothetical protein